MKYRLLKDYPGAVAGIIFIRSENGFYYYGLENKVPKDAVENNPEWFEPVIERFKPEYGAPYFMVLETGEVIKQHWINSLSDNSHYSVFNCFETEEQAGEVSSRMVKMFISYHKELSEQQ